MSKRPRDSNNDDDNVDFLNNNNVEDNINESPRYHSTIQESQRQHQNGINNITTIATAAAPSSHYETYSNHNMNQQQLHQDFILNSLVPDEAIIVITQHHHQQQQNQQQEHQHQSLQESSNVSSNDNSSAALMEQLHHRQMLQQQQQHQQQLHHSLYLQQHEHQQLQQLQIQRQQQQLFHNNSSSHHHHHQQQQQMMILPPPPPPPPHHLQLQHLQQQSQPQQQQNINNTIIINQNHNNNVSSITTTHQPPTHHQSMSSPATATMPSSSLAVLTVDERVNSNNNISGAITATESNSNNNNNSSGSSSITNANSHNANPSTNPIIIVNNSSNTAVGGGNAILPIETSSSSSLSLFVNNVNAHVINTLNNTATAITTGSGSSTNVNNTSANTTAAAHHSTSSANINNNNSINNNDSNNNNNSTTAAAAGGATVTTIKFRRPSVRRVKTRTARKEKLNNNNNGNNSIHSPTPSLSSSSMTQQQQQQQVSLQNQYQLQQQYLQHQHQLLLMSQQPLLQHQQPQPQQLHQPHQQQNEHHLLVSADSNNSNVIISSPIITNNNTNATAEINSSSGGAMITDTIEINDTAGPTATVPIVNMDQPSVTNVDVVIATADGGSTVLSSSSSSSTNAINTIPATPIAFPISVVAVAAGNSNDSSNNASGNNTNVTISNNIPTTAAPPSLLSSSSSTTNTRDNNNSNNSSNNNNKGGKYIQGRDIHQPSSDLYDWSTHYAALLKFSQEYGHCHVPFKCIYECMLSGLTEDGSEMRYFGNLGRWLDRQRQTKKGNRPESLRPEREALLQQLVDQGKFVWNASQTRDGWTRNYQALIEYGKIHGHCNIPAKGVFECELSYLQGLKDSHYKGNLGTWVEHQRQSRKGKGSPLFPDREALLQILVDEGKFMWDASEYSSSALSKNTYEAQWPMHYAALVEYGKQHGHCNVPLSEMYDCELPPPGGYQGRYSGRLGRWLQSQRMSHRGSAYAAPLSTERLAMLQQLVDEGKLSWETSSTYNSSSGSNGSGGSGSGKSSSSNGKNVSLLIDDGDDIMTHNNNNNSINSSTATTQMNVLSPSPQLLIKEEAINDVLFASHYAALLEQCKQHRSTINQQVLQYPNHIVEDCMLSSLSEDMRTTTIDNIDGTDDDKNNSNTSTSNNHTIGLQVLYSGNDLRHWLHTTQQQHKSSSSSSSSVYINQQDMIQRLKKSGIKLDGGDYSIDDVNNNNNSNGSVNSKWLSSSSSSSVPSSSHYNLNTAAALGSGSSGVGGVVNSNSVTGGGAYCIPIIIKSNNSNTGSNGNDNSAEMWNYYYAAILEYIKQHGHCILPLSASVYECTLPTAGTQQQQPPLHFYGNLSVWQFSQRLAKRGQWQREPLTAEREALLQTLVNQGHFSWEEPELLATQPPPPQPQSQPSMIASNSTAVSASNDTISLQQQLQHQHQLQLLEELSQDIDAALLSHHQSSNSDNNNSSNDNQHANDNNITSSSSTSMEVVSSSSVPLSQPQPSDSQHSSLSLLTPREINHTKYLLHLLALYEFIQQHGHANVPVGVTLYECELTVLTQRGHHHRFKYLGQLGLWLHQQRQSRPLLPEYEDIFKQLEMEGKLLLLPSSVVDNVTNKNHDGGGGSTIGQSYTWTEHHAALMNFLSVHGNCNVPLFSSLDNTNISTHPASSTVNTINDSISNNNNTNTQGWFECDLPTAVTTATVTSSATGVTAKHYTGNLGAWLRYQLLQLNNPNTNTLLTVYQCQILTQLIDEGKIDMNILFSNNSNKNNLSSTTGGDDVSNTNNSNCVAYFDPEGTNTALWHVHYTALLHYQKQYGHVNVPLDTFYECPLQIAVEKQVTVAVADGSSIVAMDTGDSSEYVNDSSCSNNNNYDHKTKTATKTIYYANYLGRWLAQQRLLHQQHSLSPEHQALLQQLVDQCTLNWENDDDEKHKRNHNRDSNDYRENNNSNHVKNRSDTIFNVSLHDNATGAAGGYNNNISTTTNSTAATISWNTHYAALLEYLRAFGYCNLPKQATFTCTLLLPSSSHSLTATSASSAETVNSEVIRYSDTLGVWLNQQRKLHKSSGSNNNNTVNSSSANNGGNNNARLTREQLTLLQQLVDEGFIHWDAVIPTARSSNSYISSYSNHNHVNGSGGGNTSGIAFTDHYAALLEYHKQYGHCNVPKQKDGGWYQCILPATAVTPVVRQYRGQLGAWLYTQKAKLKKQMAAETANNYSNNNKTAANVPVAAVATIAAGYDNNMIHHNYHNQSTSNSNSIGNNSNNMMVVNECHRDMLSSVAINNNNHNHNNSLHSTNNNNDNIFTNHDQLPMMHQRQQQQHPFLLLQQQQQQQSPAQLLSQYHNNNQHHHQQQQHFVSINVSNNNNNNNNTDDSMNVHQTTQYAQQRLHHQHVQQQEQQISHMMSDSSPEQQQNNGGDETSNTGSSNNNNIHIMNNNITGVNGADTATSTLLQQRPSHYERQQHQQQSHTLNLPQQQQQQQQQHYHTHSQSLQHQFHPSLLSQQPQQQPPQQQSSTTMISSLPNNNNINNNKHKGEVEAAADAERLLYFQQLISEGKLSLQ